MSGSTVVIGAGMVHIAGATGIGKAFVFERDQGGPDAWGQVARLNDPAGQPLDSFGRTVRIDADTIAIAAVRASAGGFSDTGGVFLFLRNEGGPNTWGRVARLTASNPGDDVGFGVNLDVDGDTVAVGAYQYDGVALDAGAVFMFERPPGGWVDASADPIQPMGIGAGDQFGAGASLDDSRLAVGAQFDDSTGPNRGKTYVLERDNVDPLQWNLSAELFGPGVIDGQLMGVPVEIVGDVVICGNNGPHSFRAPVYAFNLGLYGIQDCNANGIPDGCDIADCPIGDSFCQD